MVERSAEHESLRVWNAIPENFSCLKNFATALLSMLCSACYEVEEYPELRNVVNKGAIRLACDIVYYDLILVECCIELFWLFCIESCLFVY